jgi:hypothetical protein
MQYGNIHQRLADRRDQALSRMVIHRYSTSSDRPAPYAREAKPRPQALSLLKRMLRKLLIWLSPERETMLAK